jgi:hypothetical protein
MSTNKKILIEVNIFSKLLSLFYDKRANGQEDELEKSLRAHTNNPEYNKAYDVWKKDSERMLLSTKNMLIKAGLDTKKIDDLLKKYHNY